MLGSNGDAMSNYIINKKHLDETVISMHEIEGYKFKPKLNKDGYVKVSEVTIVDRVMIDKILTMKFNKSFKKLAALAMKVINDDDSSDDEVRIVLDEVELIREILLNKYQKFINHDKEQVFLKKLRLIENEPRMKQVRIKQKAILLEMEEQNSKGR